MFPRLLIAAYIFTACAAPPVFCQEQKSWQAGVAKTVITPRTLMWMSGNAGRGRPAEGKLHDLWAKALILRDGQGKRCVLVTMDLVGIDRELADHVCAEIQNLHGFQRDEIMLSVSHTHCGPVVGRNLITMYNLDARQLGLVEAYANDLPERLVALVDAAAKDMKSAQLSCQIGQATFAVNRRTNIEANVPKLRELGRLKGPVDHDVPVLCVRDLGGKVRAVVFGYACHATALSFYEWCGDYPGFAQLDLENRYPDAVALFHAGCGADQNPLPRRTVAQAQSYGAQLADAVARVLEAPMTPLAPGMKTVFARIELPFEELPTRDKIAQDTLSKNQHIASRAKALLHAMEKTGSLRQTYPYPVQTWQLGEDLTWIALGGEVVVDYSLRFKKELGKVWVTGYTNDVMAYIPSLRVLREGGYEGETAMIYYGLPCAWGPRVEDMIVVEVRGQVARARK